MDAQLTLDKIADMDIGYVFEPESQSDILGGRSLGINLFDKPTLQHFDPKEAILPALDQDGKIESLLIAHPWRLKTEYTVVAGFVEIIDRKKVKVEAFTFGGTLEIRNEQGKTSCLLQSPAPILNIQHASTTQTGCSLAEEVQDLLAVRRAANLGSDEDFEEKLISIQPISLFISALKSIDAKYTRLPHEESPHIADCHQTLRKALKRAIEQYPQQKNAPLIQDLL